MLATRATIAYVDDQLLLKANQATTYTIAEVDTRLSGKQSTLIVKDPTQVEPLVLGFPLLRAANIVPGIAVVPPLNITYYGNDYIEIRLSVDLALKADKATTYTITQVDTALELKANQSTTYTKTETDNLLATRQPTITSSTDLIVSTLTAQS